MFIGVLGAGESGVGAALLAKKQGYEVFVSDGREIKSAFRSELEQYGIPFEEKGHQFERLDQADWIVKSPGIPETVDIVRMLRQKQLPVISEIEFGFMHCHGRIIGVTGSNGKTTTTRLCYSLLSQGIDNVKMAGNVGTAFCRSLAEGDASWWILELSSFQLEGIRSFRADIGILLNLSPDHLDRYDGSMELYGRAKMRIAENMRPDDLLIYYSGDTQLRAFVESTPMQCRIIAVNNDWMPEAGVVEANDYRYVLPDLTLRGKHNQINAACAITAAIEADVGRRAIQKGLDGFVNAPHRMEFVAEIDGVEYINDSKATNVDSVIVALEALQKPVILIAGGQDKGNDYAKLERLISEKVKAMICLGVDNTKIKEAFSTKVDMIGETTTAGEAVKLAASLATPGDIVLLSPACASFDLFENYEHRGNAYKTAVMALEKKNT